MFPLKNLALRGLNHMYDDSVEAKMTSLWFNLNNVIFCNKQKFHEALASVCKLYEIPVDLGYTIGACGHYIMD